MWIWGRFEKFFWYFFGLQINCQLNSRNLEIQNRNYKSTGRFLRSKLVTRTVCQKITFFSRYFNLEKVLTREEHWLVLFGACINFFAQYFDKCLLFYSIIYGGIVLGTANYQNRTILILFRWKTIKNSYNKINEIKIQQHYFN